MTRFESIQLSIVISSILDNSKSSKLSMIKWKTRHDELRHGVNCLSCCRMSQATLKMLAHYCAISPYYVFIFSGGAAKVKCDLENPPNSKFRNEASTLLTSVSGGMLKISSKKWKVRQRKGMCRKHATILHMSHDISSTTQRKCECLKALER